MRRKSDMWNVDEHSFLPEEGAQAAQAAAADVQDRLTQLEDQLKSQFTSMSTFHQIAIQSVETTRAEARADLDREKATLIGLVERVRDECAGMSPATAPAAPIAAPVDHQQPAINVSALARLAVLEDRFEDLGRQVALCLRSQEELANSIAFMFEQQMRNAGFVANCAEASA